MTIKTNSFAVLFSFSGFGKKRFSVNFYTSKFRGINSPKYCMIANLFGAGLIFTTYYTNAPKCTL